jgi:hypothetical protein
VFAQRFIRYKSFIVNQTPNILSRTIKWITYIWESRFILFRPGGQRRGERFADACVLERDRFGGGSVMVWGGISHRLKSPLIVITGNLTDVRYLLSISPHRCSIGDKSGLYRGQSSGLMLWLARTSWQTLAAWGRALSCWKIRWCCCTNGTE